MVSVVVGSRRAEHDPGACLAALEVQLTDDVEVIVVDDGGDASYPSWVRRIERPGGLVPELWSSGVAEAAGQVVALLSGGVVPTPGWLDAVRSTLAGGDVAVGGPVEPGPGLATVDWAVYFCRYGPYLRPLASSGIQPAGDNAVYRADVLGQYRHVWSEGFWEPFVHAAMVADGHSLGMRPDMCVTLAPGVRAGVFSRQRFEHGRSYGMQRSIGSSMAVVLGGVATAPVVPFLMTGRAGRLVITKRRYRAKFLAALPATLWFYSWWAAGEAVGRLHAITRGGSGSRR